MRQCVMGITRNYFHTYKACSLTGILVIACSLDYSLCRFLKHDLSKVYSQLALLYLPRLRKADSKVPFFHLGSYIGARKARSIKGIQRIRANQVKFIFNWWLLKAIL